MHACEAASGVCKHQQPRGQSQVQAIYSMLKNLLKHLLLPKSLYYDVIANRSTRVCHSRLHPECTQGPTRKQTASFPQVCANCYRPGMLLKLFSLSHACILAHLLHRSRGCHCIFIERFLGCIPNASSHCVVYDFSRVPGCPAGHLMHRLALCEK